MRPRILFIVAAAPIFCAAWARAQPATDEMMTIPQAIAKVRDQRDAVFKDHMAAMQTMTANNKAVAALVQSGDLNTKAAKHIDYIQDRVIADLQARGDKDPNAMVHGSEVDSYGTSFQREMQVLRGAMRDEAKEQASRPDQLPSRDWREILEHTADARQRIYREGHADPHYPGPVFYLDAEVKKNLQDHAAAGGGQSAGSAGSALGGAVNGSDGGAAGGSGATPNGGAADAADDRIAFGDPVGARQDLAQAVQAGTADSKAYTMKGAMEYDDHSYSQAASDARAALALDPKNETAMGLLQFSQERIDGGAASAGAAALATAKSGSLGGGGAGAGAPGAASADALGLLHATGSPAKLAAAQAGRQAENALGLGDRDAALAAIGRGLTADPANPGLLGLRAEMEAKAGDQAKALVDAQAALASDPKNLRWMRAKALAQLRTKDYAGAAATANEMLEIDPKSADAFALRGQAYGLLGKNEQMAADLASAARFNPYYQQYAARAKEGTLQAPADSDELFLFPGEAGAAESAPGSGGSSGTAGNLGLMFAVAAVGGLLVAWGLRRSAALAPAADAVARLTRRGPKVGALDADAEAAGAVDGLIRGQFEITREIASGGMGRVYEGTDRALGRRVAIKKMRDELRDDARSRERFVAEAKTVAALHHPNIVDIYSIAEQGPDVYLVFEYVDGKTVHDLVQERGRLEPEEAGRIARAASEALEFAHAHGVIHRDMKPANVMIDASGQVKVMDFGIARVAADALARRAATSTIVGTPPYMAPEQEQGRSRRESDVYALGICAYEMLTGRLPFAGVANGMMLNKINMSYAAPSLQVPGLPPALDPVFARVFQPDPEKRYRTPREFADALEAALTAGARA